MGEAPVRPIGVTSLMKMNFDGSPNRPPATIESRGWVFRCRGQYFHHRQDIFNQGVEGDVISGKIALLSMCAVRVQFVYA